MTQQTLAERRLKVMRKLADQTAEASTVAADQAVEDLRDLRRRDGPRVAVWRYDPILFTSATPAAWHRRNFTALARSLAGTVDEVVVSFAQIYRKTRRNLEAATTRSGLTWRDPPPPGCRVRVRLPLA